MRNKIRIKRIGKLFISAEGLRKMADSIEKVYGKDNVELECGVVYYENKKTFVIGVESEKIKSNQKNI